MAALVSSPILGARAGFERCSICGSCNSASKSPHSIAFLDHSLNSSSRSSSLGPWSRSVEEKSRVQQRRLVVRAAEEDNFFKNIGAQFLKVGGTNGVSETASSGTQFFGLGGKKKSSQEELAEATNTGIQLFRFGAKKAGARTQVGTTNGAALAVRKEGTGLESLPFGRGRRVDPKTVFVAGATGQIGARISQQLLRAGFSVRGGVPDLYVAQQLAEFATQYGVISRDEAKRLNAVEFDFKNVTSIAKALGNAGKVVVTVGPSEDGPQGKVSRDDALRVLEAASLSNAAHFVFVTEPGTGLNADNGPLAGLTALFSRVFSIKASEISDTDLIDRIVESGLAYTIVKAGSTDGIDDFGPESGNLVVEAEGASDPSAKVSKIQVATVVAGVFEYTGVSENKFFEVTSSPYAPSMPVDELLSAIQVDGRREILEEERARLEAEEREKEVRSKAEAEAQEAIEEARKAAQLAAQLEAEAKRLASEEAKAAVVAAKAQARAEAAAASVDGLQVKAKELGGNPLKTVSGRLGTTSFTMDDKVKKPAFSLPKTPAFSLPKKQQIAAQPVPASPSTAPKAPGFFGGLFTQQESIYVDEE